MYDKLTSWINSKVEVVTKGYHVGYSIYKGYIIYVGTDFVELDVNGKSVLIAMDHISVVTHK